MKFTILSLKHLNECLLHDKIEQSYLSLPAPRRGLKQTQHHQVKGVPYHERDSGRRNSEGHRKLPHHRRTESVPENAEDKIRIINWRKQVC